MVNSLSCLRAPTEPKFVASISQPRRSKRASRRSIWRGVDDVTYRGVELAGKFSSAPLFRMGLGGRGWHGRGGLDEGYAPVVTSDDSARL